MRGSGIQCFKGPGHPGNPWRQGSCVMFFHMFGLGLCVVGERSPEGNFIGDTIVFLIN